MVCSWLANSWAWARSTWAVERNDPISCSRSASAVRSRIVVTVPSTRSPLTTRMVLMTSTRPRRMTTSSRAAVTWSSGSSRRRPAAGGSRRPAPRAAGPRCAGRSIDVPMACSGRSSSCRATSLTRVIRCCGSRAITPFGDAAQHRLAVLGEAGDLARLHPASLALDPAGEQPGPAQPDGERDAEVGEQVGRGALQPLPGRRHPLGDHHGAEVGARRHPRTRRARAPARRGGRRRRSRGSRTSSRRSRPVGCRAPSGCPRSTGRWRRARRGRSRRSSPTRPRSG